MLSHAILSLIRVDQRLACSLAAFPFNICHIDKPDYLLSQLQPTNTGHGYATRHALGSQFTLLLPRTNALRRTVMYRVVTYWNDLPLHLTLIGNKFLFKKKRNTQVFFLTGYQYEMYLYILRVFCPLKSHDSVRFFLVSLDIGAYVCCDFVRYSLCEFTYQSINQSKFICLAL